MTEKWELIWMVYDDEEGKEQLLEETYIEDADNEGADNEGTDKMGFDSEGELTSSEDEA